MNDTKGRILAMLVLISLMGFALSDNPQSIRLKLALLCQDYPQYDCERIVEYCEESLAKGQECYITE